MSYELEVAPKWPRRSGTPSAHPRRLGLCGIVQSVRQVLVDILIEKKHAFQNIEMAKCVAPFCRRTSGVRTRGGLGGKAGIFFFFYPCALSVSLDKLLHSDLYYV